MKKCSLLILTICMFVFAALPVSAQDPWWNNKTIESFDFEGLQHVSEEQLQETADSYIGSPLTSQLLQSIQDDLYDLDFFDYFFASARRSQTDEDNVILVFTMVELPLVASISIEGNSVLSNQRIRDIIAVDQGSFFSRSAFRSDADLISKEYISRGYADISVESSFETDEDQNTVSISYTIEEGLQSRIDTITFSGNENFSNTTLRRQISLKEQSLFNRGIFVESKLDDDIKTLVEYYQERGYIDASVKDVVIDQVETERNRKALSLTFVIEEGRLWRFGDLTITGNTLFSDEELKSGTRMSPGDTLNVTRLQQDINSVVEVYYNEGYIYNEVVPRETRNPEDGTISFELAVQERGQAFVENITVTGNQRTRDHVITREITLQPGEVFSRAELIRSMQNLYNTGLFEVVDVDPKFGSEEGLIDLDVLVEEANRIDLRFGATFGGGQEFPVSGFLSWNDKNFLGTGSDFAISLEASPARQSLDFSYMENWLFGRRWSGGVNLRLDRAVYSNILQDRDGNEVPDPFTSRKEYEAAGEEAAVDSHYKMEYLDYNISLGFSTGYTFHTDYGRFNVGGGYSFNLKYIDYDNQLYRPYRSSIRDNHQVWRYNNTVYLTTTWDRRDLIYRPTSGFLVHNRFTVSGGVLNDPFSFIGEPQPTNFMKNQSRIAGYLKVFDVPRTDRKNFVGVLSAESSFSFLFPQREAVSFAGREHLLFIDGMNTARGWYFDRNLEVLWDNKVKLTFPIVQDILDAEIYTSATWGHRPSDPGEGLATMGQDFKLENFKFSTGAGIKLGIQGLPLGLFLSKAYSFDSDGSIDWDPDPRISRIFGDLGLQLVFTIDYSLF